MSHESLHEKHPGISCGGKFSINGYPDFKLLSKALKLSLKSHQLLTATLRQSDQGMPFLETGVFSEPEFCFYDIRNKDDSEAAMNRILYDFSEEKFEPAGGRLCRFALIYNDDNSSWFLSRYFHLVGDGIAALAHFHLLSSIYEMVSIDPCAEPETAFAWNNDVIEDVNHIGSSRYHKDIEFYKNYLADLPSERAFTPKPGYADKIEEVGRLDLQISSESTERIRTLVKNYGGGINRILIAIHALLISRLYDSDKISIQTPVRYGERKNIQNIIGHRVNIIPVIIDFNKVETFKDLTGHIGALMREFSKRVRTPFQHGLRKLTKDLSDNSFIWDTNINYFPKLTEDNTIYLDIKEVSPVTSKYDPVLLGIYIVEGYSENDQLHFDFVYSKNHFSEKDIRNYLIRIEKVVIQLLENTDKKIEDLEILTDEEIQNIGKWEKGPAQDFQINTITELFDKTAQMYPFNDALCGINGERIDYQSLMERSDSISVWLNSLGVEPGKVVAVLASRHFRLPELILGIMKAGGIYLPIDPAYPLQRIRYFLEDSAAQIIIALDENIPVDLKSIAIFLPDRFTSGVQSRKQNVNDPAYMIYTSGSSGNPKGVLLSHAAFVNMIQGQILLFGVNSEDRVLQFASPAFDASLSEIFMALLSGAALYTINRELLDTPWTLREYMTENGISVVTLPPSYLRLFDCQEIKGLKVLITAGEAPVAEDIKFYAAKYKYFNAYGPTETAVCATLTELLPGSNELPVSIGRPLPNTNIHILDKNNRRVAPGVPGELCMSGPGLALEYLNRPQLTSIKFVENPFKGTNRIYKSGDIAVWLENGQIALLGRNDDQLKIRGHRIETGEIKSVIEGHEYVSLAFICNCRSGESSELIAFMVLKNDHVLRTEDMINYLNEKLPRYMHPTRFITIPEMPLTVNGKVDKKKLEAIYTERNSTKPQLSKNVVIADEKIKKVVNCYEVVLGERINETDLDKSFTSLGGDSLKAIELIRVLSSSAGINISLRSLMADSSPLAVSTLERNKSSDNNSEKFKSKIVQLTRGQHQLWFQSLISEHAAQYNMPLLLSISADEQAVEKLTESFKTAVECQPVYRLKVQGDSEKAYFSIDDYSGFKVEKIDLSNINNSEELLKKIIDDFIHRKFDLRSLPLIRSIMIHISESKWQWLIVMHHIVGDAESLSVLLKSTMNLASDKTQEMLSAQELKLFAEREEKYLHEKECDEDLDILHKQLTPLPSRLNLTDTPRTSYKRGNGDTVTFQLTGESSLKIDNLSNVTGSSQLVIFTALVSRFLQVLCNEKDIAVGIPVGIRDNAKLFDYCGYFVNTVILRINNPASMDEKALIDECSKQFDKNLAASRYPFMMLPAALGEQRQPDRAPLIDVLVTVIDDSSISNILSGNSKIDCQILPVNLRSSKLDYTFILHIKQDGSRELILEYDTDLASREQAEAILKMLSESIVDSSCKTVRSTNKNRILESGMPSNTVEIKECVTGCNLSEEKDYGHSEYTREDKSMKVQIADAWQKILGGSIPEQESNFFVLGGDSIKAIQICGILKRQGINNISPSHFFQYPLFGKFCSEVQKNRISTGPKINKALPGPVARLLPMQKWLFTEHADHWKKFFMLLPLKIIGNVKEKEVQKAFMMLTQQHEAFRMSFKDGHAYLLPVTPELYWGSSEENVSFDIDHCLHDIATGLFNKIDPLNGKNIAAHFIKGSNECYLLVAGHHLVLDSVSLQIICQDLNFFIKNEGRFEDTDNCGIATLLSESDKYCQNLLDDNEIKFWENHICEPSGKIISLRNGKTDRYADRITVSKTLSHVDSFEKNDMRSYILSALGKALYLSGQKENILVKMEGHGRSGVFPDNDLSRTVGWFTVTYPFLLKISDNDIEIQEWTDSYFRSLKHGGALYQFALEKKGEILAYRAQVSLNYLGELSGNRNDNPIQIYSEFINEFKVNGLIHDEFVPDTPLELTVFKDKNQELQLLASFSPNCIDTKWVNELMSKWAMVLDNDNKISGKTRNIEILHLADKCKCKAEDIESYCPVNFAQEGMLFQCELDDNAQTYSVEINFKLKGVVNTGLMEKAWLLVLQRHENLRSLFPMSSNGEYTRLVLKNCRTSVDVNNLISLPKKLQQQKREQISIEKMKKKFDLQHGPLITMNLFSYSEQDHEMSWFFHHILMDGWSAGILLDQIFKTYEALEKNTKIPLLQIISKSNSINSKSSEKDNHNARQWWKDTLSGFKTRTFISGCEITQDTLKTSLKEKNVIPDNDSLLAIRKLADRNSVSLAHVFQVLWGFLIASENNNKNRDVIYGIVSSGRSLNSENVENVVGLFVETVPLRIKWSDSEKLTDILQRVRDQAIERTNHGFLHLADIQKSSELESPLFDNILVYENYPVETISVKDAFEIYEVTGREWHPYSLSMSIVPGKKFYFRFNYRDTLISDDKIDEIAQKWLKLIHLAASEDDLICSQIEQQLSLNVITENKKAWIADEHLSEFNATARPYPSDKSIWEILVNQCRKYPQKKAFLASDGTTLTYTELERLTSSITSGLKGIRAGEPVAFAMPRGPESVIIMAAIIRAGGCYLPIDNKNPGSRIKTMLKIAGCRIVITWKDGKNWFDSGDLNQFTFLDYDDLIKNDHESINDVAIGGDMPAYILYTSGSSGEPKGVLVPHKAVLRLVINSDFWDLKAGERCLQAAPLGFDASTLEVWGTLLNGGTLSFISEEQLLSPGGLKQKIIKDRITMMWLTSSLCNIYADDDAEMFRPLRKLFTGGEALSPGHIKKIAAACPELEIYNGYGPTENTTFTTVHKISNSELDGSAIPIGRPISNTRVYIVDEKYQIVAPGEWGEICAAGDGLALKYIGREDLTNEAFIRLSHPFNERVYRTGDKGRWRNDGVIEFGGRIDGQVKIRGYRIEMSEIENRINQFQGVMGSAVISLEKDNEIHLIAFVKSEDKRTEKLVEYLKKYLPSYMIPEQFEYIESLPFTNNGKMDRKALKSILLKDVVAPQNVSVTNSLEIKLMNIFRDILGKTVDSVDSDFFQLGGHSLKALKLLNRIRKEICNDIDLRMVMENPTPSKLAQVITNRPVKNILPDKNQIQHEQNEFLPMNSAQERMWFLQKLQPDSTVYTIPFAARIKSEIELNDVQRMFSLLELRHDALRLRMPEKIEITHLQQKLTSPGSLIVNYQDYSDMPDAEEKVRDAIYKERQKPFRFGYDEPMIRIVLFKIKNNESILFINIHHIIFDGVSASVILRELQQAFNAVKTNCTPEWKDVSLSYSDYLKNAAGQNQKTEEMKKRWLKRLMPIPEALQLPCDMRRPTKQSLIGESYNFSLTQELRDKVVRLANDMHVTVFTVLMSVVNIFIYKHTSQKDFVVGVPLAGRTQPELEEMVGLLVNTIPFRCSIEPDMNFCDFVKIVSERLLDALSDQEFPLEDLINNLELPRDEMRNPLFDVLVAMEDSSWHLDSNAQYLKMEKYSLPGIHSRLDMSFYFNVDENGINISIEYSTDLFYQRTIERMAERFTCLVQSIMSESERTLCSLNILPQTEKQLVINEYNSTYQNYDTEHSIDEMFATTVSEYPDAVALHDSTGQKVSYRELDRRVDALVCYLIDNGIKRNSHVALCFERSFDLITSIFALMRIGAVYVPVPPAMVTARMRSIIEDCKDLAVLTNNQYSSRFKELNVKIISTDDVYEKQSFKKESVSPQEIAYLIYTSGSTGRPKGVMIRHKSVLNRILWMQSCFPLNENDVILQKTPVSFDVSIWELFWWSWTGASLAMLEPSGEGNPAIIADAIYKHKVTVIHFVPSMMRIFLEYLKDHPEVVSKIKSLRYVFASGEALSPDLVELYNKVVYSKCGCELHNLYGPTEATVDVTWYSCSESGSLNSIPIGKPVANTQIYILDEFKNPQPIGVKGEIYIGGVQVAAGYINQPQLTSEKFIDDPFNHGQKLYRTGDLGYWNNKGEIEYSGRIDFQVKLRGFRVELGEIEQALTSLDNISAAVVMVKSINGIDSLEAYLKISEGVTVDTENIRKSLVNKLPEYMIPHVYHVVKEIPLSASGKIDRRLLAEQKTDNSIILPVSKRQILSCENEVMDIWKLILPEIGDLQADQNFFELGGNSLLLIRLHELLEKKWPGIFTPADLFVVTTIARQAEQIESRTCDKITGGLENESNISERKDNLQKDAIAIIGMALRVSNYEQIENFWSDLLAGADRKSPLSNNRREEFRQIAKALSYPGDISNITDAAFLDDISGFDNRRFAMSPSDAELLDPEQRLFLETINRCMEDAGYGGNCLDGCSVGVFAGAVTNSSYKEAAMRSFPDRAEQIFVLNVPSNLATRISYIKNWTGPAALIDTACSSSLKAIHDACTALRNGECEVAAAGGVRILLTPLKSNKSFAIESKTGQTRTFDHLADGTGAGEGCVVFLLKPLSKALEDGDSIRAVIKGSAVNQDGRSSSIAAPNPVAQSKVIRAAAEVAGIELDSIDFFEAHGTGTVLGDPIEIDGLARAFNGKFTKKKYISSVKGNFGHLDAAAGAIGIAKAVCALQHSIIPGQAHFEKPNPKIDFEHAPVQVADRNIHLEDPGRLLRCGVSAFGLSGINAHIILENVLTRNIPPDDGSWIILVLSADTLSALHKYAEEIARCCSVNRDWPLHAIAATLVKGRDSLKVRVAFYARSREEFLNKLLSWCIEPQNDLPEFNNSLKQSQCMVAAIKSIQEAEQICDAVMKGAKPCWPEKMPIYRVNLPSVPLNRTTHWAQFSSVETVQTEKFLGEMILSPQNRIFPVNVNTETFWPVSEHRLNDQATMVGMCFPVLLGEVAKKITDSSGNNRQTIKIEGVSWLSTLQPDLLEERSVQIALTENGYSYTVTLQGLNKMDGWQEFAKASMTIVTPDVKKMDLNLIRKELKPVEKEILKEKTGEKQQVNVSGRWDCRKQVWNSEDRKHILASLELDQKYSDDISSFDWHPAMLDVAVSLALDKPGLIPVSCREIKLYKPHGIKCYSYVVIDDTNDKTGKSLKATCTVLDLDGTVAAEFVDMFFLQAAAPAPRIHRLSWSKTQVETVSRQENRIEKIMILEDASNATLIIEDVKNTPSIITRVNRPVQEKEWMQISDLIHDEKYSVLVYRIPANSFSIWELAGFMKKIISKGLREKLKILIIGKGAAALPESQVYSPDNDPVTATVPALMLSVSKEEPKILFRYLEVSAEINTNMIFNEIEHIDSDNNKIYINRSGERFEPKLLPVISTEKKVEVTAKFCTVISGGLGAMALTLADTMSELGGGGAVALLHRGVFPPEEQWNELSNSDDRTLSFRICKLLDLKAKGIKFGIYQCDIADKNSLCACLNKIREELGPVGAVLHTAGVPGDGFLIGKSKETFENVLAPKIIGVNNLHELTLNDKIKYFILASSRTGITGAAGQTDYAAANAYLDAFAHWRVSQGLPAVSIDWNSWKNIGMAARSVIADSSMPGLLPEQASDALKKALLSGETQIVISMSGEDLSGKTLKEKSVPKSSSYEKCKPEEKLMALPFQDRIMEIIAEGLGYKDKLSVDDDFYSIGGDSITGMHIVNHINRVEKLNVSLSDLFSNSRLGSFIDAIKQMQNEMDIIPEKKTVTPVMDEYPVSWEQLAVLQAETNLSPGTGYNLPQFIKLPENFDLDRLKQAFNKLIIIHEVLRTKFDRINSEKPVMKIIPEFDFEIKVIKIDTLDRQSVESLVKPFKLDDVPLFRSAILDSDKDGKVLFFDIHHSLADAKSIVILLSQLFRLYNGENVERTFLQQKDAAWLQQNNNTDEKEAEKYWLEQYKNDIPFINLPSDFLRPVYHTFKAGSVSFNVPSELVSGIRTIARQNSTTAYNFLLSVWSMLFARYASTDDLVIAVAADGRDSEDLKNTTGMFVSLIPLRMQIDENSNFKEFLEKNQRLNTEAFRYRSYSLNRLLNKLKIPASPDRTVLSEITFSYMNFESSGTVNSDFKALNIPNPSTKADLAIFATDNPEQISFSIEYYADLFTEKRIQRMSHHFLNLLRQILQKGCKLPLRSYSLIEHEEKAKIECFKSGPGMKFIDRSIDSLVWINTARQGNSVLWKNFDGSVLTWKDFDRRSTEIAEKLRVAGVKAGEGIYIDNTDCSDLPLLMLSIIRSGAFSVLSTEIKQENEVKWIITDNDAKTYMGNSAVLNRQYVLNHKNAERKGIQFDIYPESTAFRILDSNENSIDINQLTLHYLAGQFQECGISQGERVLLTENPFSLYGQIQLWSSILAGGKIAEIHNGYLSNPFQSLNKVSNIEADVLIAESSGLIRADRKDAEVLHHFKRLILIGDEVPDYHLLKSWAQLCPELNIVTALRIPGTVFLMSISEFRDECRNFLRAGRPMACNQISIVNNNGMETPIGVWGNIFLSGLVNEIASYTEGVSSENPWRRTDIVARWGDDGDIELRGLMQDSDCYSALMRSSILENECVNKVELKKNSAGEWCALVIADSTFDPVKTKRAIRKILPVQSPNFSLELAQRDKIRVIRYDKNDASIYEKSENETEKRVIQVFKDYFRKENICADDSFFSLGGHSLLGLQIINQLSGEYCKDLSIRDLYQNPSPAELAVLIGKNNSDAMAIVKSEINQTGLYPLSHAQQRLYVQHYSEGGSVAYNFTFAFRIDGKLDKQKLTEALDRLCDRHEILRTAFLEKDGQLWQFIGSMNDFSADLSYHDINQLTMNDALKLFSEDAVKPFSLDKPGLFRVRCCTIEENVNLLALTMHHIIADGWSMQLFFKELMEFYMGGKDNALNPLKINYHDYSLWQQNRNWDEEAAYWKNELNGIKQGINLPADKISNGSSHNLGVIQKVLPDELMDRIREMSRQKAVSPATLILSVFASFLYRLTRQEDMVIGMGVAGREKKELEGLIGFFVNILPMRIRVNDETDFDDLIDSVHRSSIEAVSRQDYPYDLLIRNISPDRKNTREALVNVMFEYQRYGDLSLGADINIPDLPFSVSPIYLHEHAGTEDASPARAKYDLTLFIQDMKPNCLMRAEFDASVFNGKSIESWLTYIEKFLAGITEA